MDQNTKENIKHLRRQNYSYACIGSRLGIPMNTVKSYCRRHGVRPESSVRKTKAEKAALVICKYCGKEIAEDGGQKKVFCNRDCKNAYWNEARKKR